MRWSCALLTLACATVCAESAVLRGRAAVHAVSLETSEDWAAYSEAQSEDAEDRSFLISQLDATENELVKLQQFAVVEPAKKAPEAKPTVATTAAKKVAATPSVNKTATKAPAKKEADPAKLIASFGIKLSGKAALAPMLAMLKGLYEESKDRISQANAREDKSKKWFTSKESEHQAKLAQIEGRFKNGTLSEDFKTNETNDETRYFTYWSRVRERQHRQFHTNLKIQHAMMMKTKKMIDTYEKTLSSKPSDQAQAKKQMEAAPEIVFLQEFHRTVAQFCSESLLEVRKEKAELQQLSADGVAW